MHGSSRGRWLVRQPLLHLLLMETHVHRTVDCTSLCFRVLADAFPRLKHAMSIDHQQRRGFPVLHEDNRHFLTDMKVSISDMEGGTAFRSSTHLPITNVELGPDRYEQVFCGLPAMEPDPEVQPLADEWWTRFLRQVNHIHLNIRQLGWQIVCQRELFCLALAIVRRGPNTIG